MANETKKQSAPPRQYRYPGVTPFTTEQSSVFFGRQRDTDELYRLIRREPLVVLYGKSGLGKSSLINAGIIPRCRQEGSHSPIIVRFGAWTEVESTSPLEATKMALTGGKATSSFLDRLLPDDNSLWACAKSRQLAAPAAPERPLLLFDQFEELFSYPEAEIAAFLSDLAELLNTGIPLRFRRMAESDTTLTDADEERLEAPLDARVVFAIRSDRMHLLDRLKDHLPMVLRHTFELKALSPTDAADAIVEPARAAGDFATETFEYSPEALTALLSYLADEQDKEGRVEGILLQMLCEHYERKLVEGKSLRRLEQQHTGNPDQVVQQYYEEKIQVLPADQQLPARRLIEDGLVSEGEAMRLSLHESFIIQEFGADKTLLEQLVDSRLLRSEPFLRGGYTYELSHDRLVPPVLKARGQRREEEARLEAARLETERQRKLEEAQRQAEQERQLRQQAQAGERRARQRTRLAAGVSAVALVLAAVAFWSYSEAQRQADIATEKSVEAEANRKNAQEALDKFIAEQAAKSRLEFNNKEARANTILSAGGCPQDLLIDLKGIADSHPDSVKLRERLQVLRAKNLNCR
ncbi:MAG: hypothetical protein IPM36_01420 [Lewinellaceae bacterium]|nr:hypothetical protein [Lewinellaceae bacterium]